MKALLNIILEEPRSGDEESRLNFSTCSLGTTNSSCAFIGKDTNSRHLDQNKIVTLRPSKGQRSTGALLPLKFELVP